MLMLYKNSPASAVILASPSLMHCRYVYISRTVPRGECQYGVGGSSSNSNLLGLLEWVRFCTGYKIVLM
jgi:hypothetical protein